MLRRRVRINAKGKELYKFINDIHGGGITCLGQYVKNDVFHGEVFRCHLKRVRSIAEKYDIELKEAEYITVMSVLSRYRKRIGIFLGIAAALLCCIRFSQTVVTIEIQGNSKVSDEVILSTLSQLDIRRGKRIRDIDMHYCEHELQIRVSDISWAAIRRTGNRIVVQVTEITEKPEMQYARIPCNIVSSKDAEITEVKVLDGMLMHKVGDFVPKGTLLISGVAEDDTGHITLHRARGCIKGIYTETAEFEGEFVRQSDIPTGRTFKEHYLRLFGLDIPLFWGRNKYQYADETTTEKQAEIFGKKLPVSIITRRLDEKEVSEIEYTEDELKQQLNERIYLYEKNFLGKCKIIDRKIKCEKSEESLVLKVTYKLEGDIGVSKDIFVKKQ